MIRVDKLKVGAIQTNCYIVFDKETKEALAIDPGDESGRIISFLKEKELGLKAILLTHGHFDHITGVNGLRKSFPAPLYASIEEKELLADPIWNCSSMMEEVSLSADVLVSDQQKLDFGCMSCRVIASPGHTRGSVCYYFEQDKALFSGDTLFFEGLGRTDLPTGNGQRIIETVKKLLTDLEDDVTVYPGHGNETTIGYEKRNNPYINENAWE